MFIVRRLLLRSATSHDSQLRTLVASTRKYRRAAINFLKSIAPGRMFKKLSLLPQQQH
jgi:hypothetical protein